MALADYRLCDICESKVFYDANLNYQSGQTDWYHEPIDETNSLKYCGEMAVGLKLDNLGDWAVICQECAKNHKCIVVSLCEEKPNE